MLVDNSIKRTRLDNFALEISDLRKVYSGGTEALKGISLKVKREIFTHFLGPMVQESHNHWHYWNVSYKNERNCKNI